MKDLLYICIHIWKSSIHICSRPGRKYCLLFSVVFHFTLGFLLSCRMPQVTSIGSSRIHFMFISYNLSISVDGRSNHNDVGFGNASSFISRKKCCSVILISFLKYIVGQISRDSIVFLQVLKTLKDIKKH